MAVAITSRPLLVLRLATSAVQEIGAATIFPVIGGSFDGERLRGNVLAGGGDWVVKRADGTFELDLRVTLQTDDGALIHMTFSGIRRAAVRVPQPPGRRRHRRDSSRRTGAQRRRDPLKRGQDRQDGPPPRLRRFGVLAW